MSTSTFRRFFGLLGWVLMVPSALTALGAAWLLASGMNLDRKSTRLNSSH